jgi:5'(3')-deoxyribonucleotidase
MKKKLTIFIDMDGVLADFKKAADVMPDVKNPDEVLDFSKFEVMPGAKKAVAKIIAMGHDVFIASTPPWNNPDAWGQKRNWIEEHFPALKRKVFLTHRKDLLIGDILIDDTTYRGQKDFNGTFLHFGQNELDWATISTMLGTQNTVQKYWESAQQEQKEIPFPTDIPGFEGVLDALYSI